MIKMSGFKQNNPTPKNILRGIVPSVNFTYGTGITVPTNLSNATDGNPSTVCGTGTATISGTGTVGMYIFDLGSINTVLFSAKLGLWSSTNGMSVYIDMSPDNTNWYQNSTNVGSFGWTAEGVISLLTVVGIGIRYIRIRITSGASATHNINLYEATEHAMGI